MNVRRNKTIFSCIICISLMVTLCMFAIGCNREVQSNQKSVVCTVFPIYDWTSQITVNCSNIKVSYLADSGEDMHSYQPSADDMIRIAGADAIVYIGGESEEWLKEYLENNPNPERREVCLFDLISQKAAFYEEEDGLGDEQEEEEQEEEIEYDEHIYMSIDIAKLSADEICNVLCEVDSEEHLILEESLLEYKINLDNLSKEYKEALEGEDTALIIADRFPFLYLCKEYGLNYYAAFKGCSAETNANFETVTTLISLYDASDAGGVFVTESSNKELARTVIDNSERKSGEVYVLNSMQSVSTKDIEEGASYIGYMKSNLDVIKEALK